MNYNSLQTEGYNTYHDSVAELSKDKAEKKLSDARMDIVSQKLSIAKRELIQLIGEARALRAVSFYGDSIEALAAAKSQIAAGKCRAA